MPFLSRAIRVSYIEASTSLFSCSRGFVVSAAKGRANLANWVYPAEFWVELTRFGRAEWNLTSRIRGDDKIGVYSGRTPLAWQADRSALAVVP